MTYLYIVLALVVMALVVWSMTKSAVSGEKVKELIKQRGEDRQAVETTQTETAAAVVATGKAADNSVAAADAAAAQATEIVAGAPEKAKAEVAAMSNPQIEKEMKDRGFPVEPF